MLCASCCACLWKAPAFCVCHGHTLLATRCWPRTTQCASWPLTIGHTLLAMGYSVRVMATSWWPNTVGRGLVSAHHVRRPQAIFGCLILSLDRPTLLPLLQHEVTKASHRAVRLFYTLCAHAGVIQATERDEFSYQEMITHLPLCALKVMEQLARLWGDATDRGDAHAGALPLGAIMSLLTQDLTVLCAYQHSAMCKAGGGGMEPCLCCCSALLQPSGKCPCVRLGAVHSSMRQEG